MVSKIDNKFQIQLKYDPEFEKLIADGKMPDGRIKIRVNDEYLIGGEDHYVESIMTGLTLVDLLKAAENTLAGFSGDVELLDSGTYLVIEPHEEGMVTLTKCFSPTAVEDQSERHFDPFVVTKDDVISEIIRITEEWRDDALDVNPDIETVEWFERLQQSISDVKLEYQ
ncbi:hypothetical protein [Halorussus sp. MSC15.2]|uniref:hypothetical protein n=1 Tax=Halorussus sp. MSC15.2 TaxID=2283638 RepID=UPI0013D6F7BA|nr:hypothetical protein [Halorussus sp. MSC15.2]NEU59202.1 hypothetical protein [Halorussus sp. MSC15.2]